MSNPAPPNVIPVLNELDQIIRKLDAIIIELERLKFHLQFIRAGEPPAPLFSASE